MKLINLSKIVLERNDKTIPSKVFYNHIFAINYHIRSCSERYNLKSIDYYCSLKLNNTSFNIDTIRKLLWNAWSTEYAYTIGAQVNNDEYYRFALHWNFPQAYYSVYLAMTAFHETQGMANDQHEKSIKQFGNSVKDGHYPKALSFHATGPHEMFEYHNLDLFKGFPKDFSGLSRIESLDEAQIQIALFLKTTRIKNAEHKREKLEGVKDKKFLNKRGEFRKKFSPIHWNQIYKTIPVTTILNILYRLRIKANYHDIETFINAEIDFKTFHESLGEIVNYINFVHEAYIIKIIGKSDYEKILHNFPGHLNENTAVKRYREHLS